MAEGVTSTGTHGVEVRGVTVHALIGESGAGRSTLRKVLYGVQKADEGTVLINGTERRLSSAYGFGIDPDVLAFAAQRLRMPAANGQVYRKGSAG